MNSAAIPRFCLALAMLAILGSGSNASAQSAGGSGVDSLQGSGRHHGSGHRQTPQSDGQDGPAPVAPVMVPEPRQRLDAGAVLCPDEQSLALHQVAVDARLDGRPAHEPAGCRIVPAMTKVAVLARNGLARTQVRTAGDAGQTGWTNAMVRDEDQASR